MVDKESNNLLPKFRYDCCFGETDLIICKNCLKVYHYACCKKVPDRLCCGEKLNQAYSPNNHLPSTSPKGYNISEENMKNVLLEDKIKQLSVEVNELKDKLKGYEVYEELKNLNIKNIEKPTLTIRDNLHKEKEKLNYLNNIDFKNIAVPGFKNVTSTNCVKLQKKKLDFNDFMKQNSNRNKSYTIISERAGDLFSMDEIFSLACCTGEDFHLNKGIGLLFRNKFRMTEDLKNFAFKIGDVVSLKDNGRYIYYLVTKKKSYEKPTLESMFKCVVNLREHMVANNTLNLAIPRLGCGLDRLKWKDVKFMFQYLFQDLKHVQIVVCNFEG